MRAVCCGWNLMTSAGFAGFLAFFCLSVELALSAEPAQRPQFDLTTDERFEAASVPAYQGDHPAIYAYIDEHLDDHLQNMQRWLRQPSISAQNEGVREMAEMLRDDLRALGFQEAENKDR